MIELWSTANIVIDCDPAAFEKAFAEVFEVKPELPAECWNEAPIDCDRAHQATIDLCRGGR